eukprot:8598780-Pyramimonas_sp.AAC.1
MICAALISAVPPMSPRNRQQLLRSQPPREQRGPVWIRAASNSAGPSRRPRKWRRLRSSPHTKE